MIILGEPREALTLVAVAFAVLNLRASITLGESIYFDKEEWISRIRLAQKKIEQSRS